jgi:DNA-binding transcriptional regulator YiaG
VRKGTFADELRRARKRLGCSQSAAVLLLPGLPLRTLQAWERGQQDPPKYVQTLILSNLKQQ